MKKLLIVLSLLLVGSALPARANETSLFGNPDLIMSFGYKLWLNNWASWNSNSGSNGVNYVEFQQGGVANMIPMALKYKNFFTTLSFMFTGDYDFPHYTDNLGGVITTIRPEASRDEIDWNVGYYVVPGLGFTVGLKNVNQHWRFLNASGVAGSTEDFNWIGPTFGITGGAGIGHGFSLYGNGVGGFMTMTHDLQPAAETNTASYEGMEMGLAWKPQTLPMNVSFGYKYQRINTKTETGSAATDSILTNLRGVDLTSGYTLGINAFF